MKKVYHFIFLSIVFIMTFIVVFPKQKLYYFLQEKLVAYNITLESEEVVSHPFSLELKNTHILLANSKVASVKHLTLTLVGAELLNVRSLGTFKNMLPVADRIDAHLSLGEVALAQGSFGEIAAVLDLDRKKLILQAKMKQAVKNQYNTAFAQFKKQGDMYVYELSF